jgi:HPt (histidine-containing phosphotransfer) domain-containing protein
MIDWQRVAQLKEEVGAEDFGEVADLFLEEVAEGLAALQPECGPEIAAAQLHALKGAALNLGFAEFAGLCASFEVGAFGAGEQDQLKASFTATKAEFDAKCGSNLP